MAGHQHDRGRVKTPATGSRETAIQTRLAVRLVPGAVMVAVVCAVSEPGLVAPPISAESEKMRVILFQTGK